MAPGRVLAVAVATAMLLLAGCGDDGGPEPDTSPPQVVSTDPADGATGVARDQRIKIFFDEAIDNQRVTWDDMLHMVGPNDQNLYGNGSYDLEEHAATLSMAFDFLPGATYKVVLERGLCDLVGNCTTAGYEFSFTASD